MITQRSCYKLSSLHALFAGGTGAVAPRLALSLYFKLPTFSDTEIVLVRLVGILVTALAFSYWLASSIQDDTPTRAALVFAKLGIFFILTHGLVAGSVTRLAFAVGVSDLIFAVYAYATFSKTSPKVKDES